MILMTSRQCPISFAQCPLTYLITPYFVLLLPIISYRPFSVVLLPAHIAFDDCGATVTTPNGMGAGVTALNAIMNAGTYGIRCGSQSLATHKIAVKYVLKIIIQFASTFFESFLRL